MKRGKKQYCIQTYVSKELYTILDKQRRKWKIKLRNGRSMPVTMSKFIVDILEEYAEKIK
jgi:hypothetical protein